MIERVACIGSGLVGHSWATLFALKGCRVKIQDLNMDVSEGAIRGIRRNLDFMEQYGLATSEDVEAALERVEATISIREAVQDAEYVQESVVERYDVKKEVFKRIDEATKPDTIIASSTSSLLISEIQKAASRPGRCLTAHPFNPPHLIPLVELVPGKETSPETIKTVEEFMKGLGKAPVILRKEVYGHIANRLASALWREALDLVDQGVASVEDVDRALTMGPAIRWVFMGSHLTYHLGGGAGGIEYFIDHLGEAHENVWRTMHTWTAIPYTAAKKVIAGVEEMKIVKERSYEELVRWRDERLADVLKLLQRWETL
jgi:3-hydroxypropionate dehydrogenase (NADP+)